MRKFVPMILFLCLVATLVAYQAFSSVSHNPAIIREQIQTWAPDTIIQAAISIIFIGASLFVILSQRYAPDDRHWAYGALGTILGFWLKAS